MKLSRALEAPRVGNDMYQPMELCSNVQKEALKNVITWSILLLFADKVEDIDAPNSYTEVTASTGASNWLGSMKQEMKPLTETTLIPL